MVLNQILQPNRSFSRRIGKTLSNLQKELLNSDLPNFSLNKDLLSHAYKQNKEILLEIGFGMGEHFIHQAKSKKGSIFIGAEVYLNGVANVLKLAKEHDVTNFYLWPNDLDLILKDFPDKSLSGIYILFPDPWPKRNQHKKRIFNKDRLDILQNKLKNNGFLIFASDIDDYFKVAVNLIINNGNFKIIDDLDYMNNYIPTKYHKKAQDNGNTPKFVISIKLS